MGWEESLFTWAVIIALGYATWKFKVEPELKRRKETESDKKVVDTEFKRIP